MGATPAIAAAEKAKVRFALRPYAHDPDADAYGLEAAEKLGVEPERVFKTLVVSLDGSLALALVPAARQLDLRALGKRAQLAERADAERTTGYVAGGISPLGGRRPLPTLVDESALEHETILVSAGRRGLQIELDPRDLIRLTGARVDRIATGR
jgi:Cys-tRNA(Pro)/Cys-tRNA(Cys) deacylase